MDHYQENIEFFSSEFEASIFAPSIPRNVIAIDIVEMRVSDLPTRTPYLKLDDTLDTLIDNSGQCIDVGRGSV